MWQWIERLIAKMGWVKKLVGLLTQEYPGRPLVLAGLGIVAGVAMCVKLMGSWEGLVPGAVGGLLAVVVIRVAVKPLGSEKLQNQVLSWFSVLLVMAVAAVLAWAFIVGVVFPYMEKAGASAATDTAGSSKPTPLGPDEFPSIDEIPDLPTAETVNKSPEIRPQQVCFGYKNATGASLKLLMFNCYYYHFPPKDDPMAPQDAAWQVLDLSADNKPMFFSEFHETSKGWFTFFVKRLDDGKHYHLKTTNIFYSDRPAMTVMPTGDPQRPFEAIFSSFGKNNEFN